ncbi:MAG: hypothetical protein KGL35_04320 [Bradyrhizobium sp.]|nr:hypothetical protein [Bradyrhizobium sp.]
MKYLILAILASLLLSGCGTVNPAVSAFENKAGTDYMGAKANIQQADDMKLRVWLDGACAVNIGALQRAISTSGNPSIANAIFTACPVPAVGVTSTSATGSMQVQTFNLPPIVRDNTPPASTTNTMPQVITTIPPSEPAPTPAKKATRQPVKAQKTPSQPPVQPAISVPVPVTSPVTTSPPPPSLSLPSALPGQ